MELREKIAKYQHPTSDREFGIFAGGDTKNKVFMKVMQELKE